MATNRLSAAHCACKPVPANDDPRRAPPFDPNNPDHVRAWESMWQFALTSIETENRPSQLALLRAEWEG